MCIAARAAGSATLMGVTLADGAAIEPARSAFPGTTPAVPVAVANGTDIPTSFARASIEPDPSRPGGRMLYLNDIECSYVDLTDPTHLEFGYVKRFADAIETFFDPTQPLRATHIGGGGVTLPRYLSATRRSVRQIVYEIDEKLIELVREQLGLRTGPELRVKIGDARLRMDRRSTWSADLIVGDAFFGRMVPPHLASMQFARVVRRVLRPGGLYVLNVIDAPPLAFARSQAATLLATFGDVALATDPEVLRSKSSGNVVFVASDSDLPIAALRRRAAIGRTPDRVLDRNDVLAFAGSARPLPDPVPGGASA